VKNPVQWPMGLRLSVKVPFLTQCGTQKWVSLHMGECDLRMRVGQLHYGSFWYRGLRTGRVCKFWWKQRAGSPWRRDGPKNIGSISQLCLHLFFNFWSISTG